MDPTDNAIFSLAEKRMHWLDQRQSVLAQNIANSNTPNYKARDLPSFAAALADQGVTLRATNPLHLGSSGDVLAPRQQPGAGRAPDGNTVGMEEQLGKVAETSSSQELVTNLYHKYKSMFDIVLGRSG